MLYSANRAMRGHAIIGALLLSFALPVEAQMAYKVRLTGVNPKNRRACELRVVDYGFDGAEQTPQQFWADLTTGRADDGGEPSIIRVKVTSQDPRLLVGQAGDDVMRVRLKSPQPEFENFDSFTFRWMHGSHPHTDQCQSLRVAN